MSYDPMAPAEPPYKSLAEALTVIREAFATNTLHHLTDHQTFNHLFDAVATGNPKVVARLPEAVSVSIRRKDPARGLNIRDRRAILDFFAATHQEPGSEAPSGNIPPSRPEQCALPEAEQELPDWLRMAEARLQR